MGPSGHRGLLLLAAVLLRRVSSSRLRIDFQGQEAPNLADFGAALPEGTTVSEAELDAIVQHLVEAQHDEDANRCTISLEPLLVDNKVSTDGLVVVVEPPGEGARPGSEVRVNMYNVPAARRWLCVDRPVDPVINLPLRNTSRVLVLSELEGPLCPHHRSAMPRELSDFATVVSRCQIDEVESRLEGMNASLLRARDEVGRTPLYWAVVMNCLRGAELLLERMDNASVGVSDYQGWTVLHRAALSGRHRFVSLILPHMDQAAINARVRNEWEQGATALTMAAQKGFVVTTRKILAASDTDQLRRQYYNGYTGLHYAANPLRHMFRARHSEAADEQTDKAAVIGMFLERMDDDAVLLRDRHGWTALHVAARFGASRNLEALLSGVSARVAQAPDGAGWTVLHHAANYDLPDVLHTVLQFVPDDEFLGVRTNTGSTALHLAMVRRGAIHCDSRCETSRRSVKELLQRMGQSAASMRYISARDDGGMTALHAACSNASMWFTETSAHHANVVLLLDYMDEDAVAAVDVEGRTALHHAARRGLRGIARDLLTRMGEAAIRAQDENGMTALHLAAVRGDPWMVGLIVKRMDRSALQARDAFGQTAQELAFSSGHLASAARISFALTF